MKSIFTKFHGPGYSKGSRIIATDSTKENRFSVSLDPAWNTEESHKQAALALCKKMGWKGTLVQGGNGPGSEVFVFLNNWNRVDIP
jgi:hypothetical protein